METTRASYCALDEAIDWVQRFNADPADAMRALYQAYSRHVLAFAFRRTGNWESAQDVAQETFHAVRRQIHAWRGDCSFRSWVFSIAYKQALLVNRVRTRRHEIIDSTLSSDAEGRNSTVVANAVAGDPTPIESLISTEAEAFIADALAALSSDHREILRLKYVEKFSNKKIADELSWSEGRVRKAVFEIYKALRVSLSPLRDLGCNIRLQSDLTKELSVVETNAKP